MPMLAIETLLPGCDIPYARMRNTMQLFLALLLPVAHTF